MQLKDKEKAINEKLDMITNIVEEYRDVFTDIIREINIKNSEYYWGGTIYCIYKKHTKIRITVGFEKRYNTISSGSSIGILFEGFWESLGLFVKKKSTYDQIEMDSNEEAIRKIINIFIELMNEVDEIKPIYLYDKE